MKIKSLKIQNFRSIESLDLTFPRFYSAICGKNDSGKTNIVRAIRGLMKEERIYDYDEGPDFSFKEDYPKWKQSKSSQGKIFISIILSVNKDADEGLYQFVSTFLSLALTEENIDLHFEAIYSAEDPKQEVKLTINNQTYDHLKSLEVLKKIQSSQIVFFYNSTELDPRFIYGRGAGGTLREISGSQNVQVENMKKTMNRSLKKIAKKQQADITELLSRFETKFKVGLSLPTFEIGYMPFNITLGDTKIDVDLDNWGSGTRNRTLILMTLFRAHRISESSNTASKITPIIVIEEPESFLHPSAQAEFGRVLQSLAEEFKVQVLATSHSPYMLSQDKPESNILLERTTTRKQLRGSVRVNTTGDNWMKPFGLSLGIDNDEFIPWREMFFSSSDCLLLVEGDTDKEYFELLRDPKHGEHQLKFTGEIYPYGGCGNIRNTVLLRFIKNRYKNIFVTYDLDVECDIEKIIISLGFQKQKNYLGIGQNLAGKKDIEGLLPDSVITSVYSARPELVQQALNGTADEKRSAKQNLKSLLLQEFKAKAKPGDEYYKKFYLIVKTINRAFQIV
jgi:putative ATP-dependent endonuclease of the OLD family